MSGRPWEADVDAIRKVLVAEWNPIGADVLDDKYDRYIGGIYGEL